MSDTEANNAVEIEEVAVEAAGEEVVDNTEETAVSIEFDENFVAEEISVMSLLKAGAHFGHKTERWNPKMLPYIYGQRNNVHIINLDQTYSYWIKARKYVHDIVSRGGSVLFVGTKLQARPLVEAAARRSGSYYITNRWLGGTLSNFQTLKNSMRRMKSLEDLLEQSNQADTKIKIAKKEKLSISRQVEKLQHNLGGIREMRKLPDLLFVLDVNKESIAVAEAKKLQIPVVALVDTNVDPAKVDMPIPSNDDAYKAIKLFVDGMAEAIIEAKKVFKNRMQEQAVINAKASAARSGKPGKGASKKRTAEVVPSEGLTQA